MLPDFVKARIRPVGSIFVIVLVLDQLTKHFARLWLRNSDSLEYLSGGLSLSYAENTGAFLSLGAQMSDQARLWIFTVGVSFVLIWAAYLLLRRRDLDRVEVVGLALLFSGGLGNLIDRVWRGSVTDFMQMGWGPFRTGIFNVADMAILAGVGMMLLHSYVAKKKTASPDMH